MICVSIAQTSQTLALVDMLNAGRACDLIEVRLDRFTNPPEIKELLATCPKPAIVSCRRVKDGGHWEGSEASRLALLRQAVLDKADYIEIESDVADQIRRFGPTKRIISYTNTSEVPGDLESIYTECCNRDADVVKITVPTRTPEEAFPLLKIVARGQVPTVAVGWGRNGLMWNVLGRRYKAPWTFAALEKGMEPYPGMATIDELREVFDYQSIDSRTPLVAVSGFSQEQLLMARVLNQGFKAAGNKTRCLPLEIGNVELFVKVVKAIKLEGVLVDDRQQERIVSVATDREESVELAKSANFVAISGDRWKAFNTLYRAARACLEEALRERYPTEVAPLNGRTAVIVGATGTARAIALSLRKRGTKIVVADRDEERARRLAADVGGRFVPAGIVYTTMCDGMILCRSDVNPQPGKASIDIPKSVARENMFAVDLTHLPFMTPFLQEVQALGGVVVRPVDVFIKMMNMTLKAYTGQAFAPEVVRGWMPEDNNFQQ